MRRRAFTLIELLVVIAIIAVVGGMIFIGTARDRRGVQVRAAADQLAAVLRQTRAMAMQRKATFGVAFNLANARGSSGRVLNNNDGGHWYRVIGPSRSNQQNQGYTTVHRPTRGWSPDGARFDLPVRKPLEEIAASWVGERQPLPARAVRFLALGDQDNGAAKDPGNWFGPSYPRPWCGWWSAADGRLYAWGGYDPELAHFGQNMVWYSWNEPARTSRAGSPLSFTGFFYEGIDGPITGCTQPTDRLVHDDADGNGWTGTDESQSYALWKAGESRPLVNADWLDALIIFHPDGSARFEDWARLRHEFGKTARDNGMFNERFAHNLDRSAMGDMCNQISDWEIGQTGITANNRSEVAHYQRRTGFWYITLAPDADDRWRYGSADEALDSLMPAVRVGVSQLGEVVVVDVKRALPKDARLHATPRGAWWERRSCGLQGYADNLWLDRMPVEDAITPEMLRERAWWLE